ncbi:MAG TPA: ABC transporter substrate binding protein [Candidatus Binatia bacterium]
MNRRSWVRWPDSFSDNLKSKIENLKWLRFSVIAFVLVVCGAVAQAQQPKKIAKIAYLAPSTPAAAAHLIEAFRQGLRELGYVEGKTCVLEVRYGEARFERLPELARELVGLKVDVIVTATDPAIAVVKRETQTIPIVMANSTDPVGTGFVASLARPGAQQYLSGAQWEAAGAAQGSRPQALPRGVSLESRYPGRRA